MNKSFLKWMGGKSKVMPKLQQYLPKGKRLIEPFVGGGNVFINTDYKEYLLADINQDLINVFYYLKNHSAELIEKVDFLFNQQIEYYKARETFNNSAQNITRASLFIYLNRHCFNGVCRYNQSGKFNVPQGKHNSIYNPKKELLNFSEKLNKNPFCVDLLNADFKETIIKATDSDVIYCDPPYLPSGYNVSFNGYTKTKFEYEETECLAIYLYDAVKRGASAVVSNHDTKEARYLFRQFNIYSIDVNRSVSANGNRQKAKEIIAVLTPNMI